MVRKIEKARKQGKLFDLKYRKSPAPRTARSKNCCHKFKENPNKFFTKPPLPVELEQIKLKNNKDYNRDNNSIKENKIPPFLSNSIEENDRDSRSISMDNDTERLNEIINKIDIRDELKKTKIENKKIIGLSPLSNTESISDDSPIKFRKHSF